MRLALNTTSLEIIIMAQKQTHIGDHRIQTAGNAEISSTGGHTAVAANGLDGKLMLSATKLACQQCGSGMLTMENSGPGATKVSLQSGPLGSILIGLGPALLGPRMTMSPTEIEIAIGASGIGASIKMTAVSILLNVAGNTYELSPTGISEAVMGVTTREATAEGHTLQSAESKHVINSMGSTIDAPTSTIKAATNGESNAGAASTTEGGASAVLKGAMVMIN